jgi:hypothetical protein
MTRGVREVDGELVVFGSRYGVEPVADDVVAFVGGEPFVEVVVLVGDFEDLGDDS